MWVKPWAGRSHLRSWLRGPVGGLGWWSGVTEESAFPLGSWKGVSVLLILLAPVMMALAWPCLPREAEHHELWRLA